MSNLGHEANIMKYKLKVASLRNSDQPLKLAHAVRHLGDAYYYAGRLELAEPCLVEALSIYRNEDHGSLDLANAIRSFAVLKDELGDFDGAHRLWQEVHNLYRSVDVPAGVAESAARLALLAYRQGDLAMSHELLAEARKAAQVTNDPETLQFLNEVESRINDE